MNPERFQAMVAAYGAAPRRWPQAERDEGGRMARTDFLRAEAALDSALDLSQARFDLDAFAARALARVPAAHTSVVRIPARLPRRAFPAWLLAACALIGVIIGFSAGSTAPTDAADRSVAAALGALTDANGDDTDG